MNYLTALPNELTAVLNAGDTVVCTITDAYTRLTSPKAIATYKAMCRMALHLAIAFVKFTYALALWFYAQVKVWVDAQVSDALPNAKPFIDELNEQFARVDEWEAQQLPEVDDDELPGMWQASDFDFPVYYSPRSTEPSHCFEDALDRSIELEAMTLTQLRPIAAKLNLATRKVKKADLIDNILIAENNNFCEL